MTRLASLLWGMINGVRRFLYRINVLASVTLPVPVVSVGNLEAGGTGKTPVVIALLKEAVRKGLVPVVLTRGYRGRWSPSGGIIAPGREPVDPTLCGDEAALIHQEVPEAWIAVGADRLQAFSRLLQHCRSGGFRPPNWVVLEDGYQHLAIQRDLDLVLLTSHTMSEKIYREWSPRSGSILLWTKGERAPEAWEGEKSLRLRARARYRLPSPSQAVCPLWMISGVGAPNDFEKGLRAAGWEIARRTDWADHVNYERSWLDQVLVEAEKEGLFVATTGKDFIKWKALGVHSDRVLVFEPELQFEPSNFVEAIIERSLKRGEIHA